MRFGCLLLECGLSVTAIGTKGVIVVDSSIGGTGRGFFVTAIGAEGFIVVDSIIGGKGLFVTANGAKGGIVYSNIGLLGYRIIEPLYDGGGFSGCIPGIWGVWEHRKQWGWWFCWNVGGT